MARDDDAAARAATSMDVDAADGSARDEATLWARFSQTGSAEQFCGAWLAILCRSLPRARSAFLLVEEEPGQYKAAATWPDPAAELGHLAPAAELALHQRRGLVHAPADDPGHEHLTYPVEVAGHAQGVVVVECRAGSAAMRTAALRQMHWGVGWLEALFARGNAERDRVERERNDFALDVLAAVADQVKLAAAAMAAVNTLAARLPCRRASFGVAHPRTGIRLAAISHGTDFRRHARLVTAIENAMEEALDQAATISLPPLAEAGRPIAIAHGALGRLSGAAAVASVILWSHGKPVGVLTVERDGGVFDEVSMARLQAAAALVAPVLRMKRAAQRLVAGRVADALGAAGVAVLGPGRPGARLIAILAASVVLTLVLWHQPDTVSGKAVIEAAQLHAVIAPYDGFVTEAPHRAGDAIAPGETLAQLDDHDLRLETLRAQSALEEQVVKYGEALGKQDRVATRVLEAGIAEARAQLAIIDGKRARARLASPIGGLIVSGDLSQMIGAPVERGKTLFEVAPADRWRIAIEVDESDIARVRPGQRGGLVLAGLTGHVIPLTVRAVLPIATGSEGQTTFRVEAMLDEPAGATRRGDPGGGVLRPGMEGIGKIRIGPAAVLTIWLRPVLAWARLAAWRWWP